MLNNFFGGLEAYSVAIFYHKNCTVHIFFSQLNSFSVFSCETWIWIRIYFHQKAWIRIRIQLIWIRKSIHMKNLHFLCQHETVSSIEISIKNCITYVIAGSNRTYFRTLSPCWCVGSLPDILLNATTGNIDGRIHASQLHVRLTIASCYTYSGRPAFLHFSTSSYW